MFTFLVIMLIADSLLLAAVVLLQAGKGGGLAAMGGGASTDSFFGGRQATTILTKMSWWCGGLFLGISRVLSAMSASTAGPAFGPGSRRSSQPHTAGASRPARSQHPPRFNRELGKAVTETGIRIT